MATMATTAGQLDGKMEAHAASVNLSHLKLRNEVDLGCGVKHL